MEDLINKRTIEVNKRTIEVAYKSRTDKKWRWTKGLVEEVVRREGQTPDNRPFSAELKKVFDPVVKNPMKWQEPPVVHEDIEAIFIKNVFAERFSIRVEVHYYLDTIIVSADREHPLDRFALLRNNNNELSAIQNVWLYGNIKACTLDAMSVVGYLRVPFSTIGYIKATNITKIVDFERLTEKEGLNVDMIRPDIDAAFLISSLLWNELNE